VSLMHLAEAARILEGELHGRDSGLSGVGTDTRALQPGELFVALRGPHFDGHDFLEQAHAAGAAGALVERRVDSPLAQLVVADTRLALGRLAAAHRARYAIPLVAVTGSNGKTTVKEMLAAILGQQGPVLATRGNLNNDIGMPLTLLRLRPEHRCAVIEMGANHPGEIAYLTSLARPTVALVSNAGPAHLEGFGDLEGVARAKGEIYSGLGDEGIAVINADDRFAPYWDGLNARRRCWHFGMQEPAEVGTEPAGIRFEVGGGGAWTRFRLRTPLGDTDIGLPLAGWHNVMNALAAAAGAMAVGADLSQVRAGLESMRPVTGRLQPRVARGGGWVLNDSYNANPASLQAAIEVLGACPGTRWLILGDMAELGRDADALHAAAGEQARAAGIERLWATGVASRAAAEAFGRGGRHFADQAALIEALLAELGPDAWVLVKGSRSARMERVVEAITGPAGDRD
jgi:UDP-N-acetylmuramoyl-tripeptide--D-alanyl-D-alanine ligase